MSKKIIVLSFFLLLISCHSSKSVIATAKAGNSKVKSWPKEVKKSASRSSATSDLVNDYIIQYKDIAMNNMRKYGIPASIILAQGILESGAGQGKLAATANNHFGIKCYTDWTGKRTFHDDDASQECFRKYNNPEESYQDHAAILSKRLRYASLFKLPKGDYVSWANGLKAAGYATDPNYPEKLNNYIERYHLDQYDNIVLGKENAFNQNQNEPTASKVVSKPNYKQYEVQKGDTLYSIAKKFTISVEELKSRNNIFDNAISIGQIILIK
jgi:flagellum-specific peptidoglycan hydrolase FlgJ